LLSGSSSDPTAVHAIVEVQDTSFSSLASSGLGALCSDQRAPSQASTSTFDVSLSKPLDAPTAMHDVGVSHDTEPSPVGKATGGPSPCAGVGVVRIDQREPFHSSASVRLCTPQPTAMQARGDTHEIADRAPPRGSGSVCNDHLVPFQRANRSLAPAKPIAAQNEREAHDSDTRPASGRRSAADV